MNVFTFLCLMYLVTSPSYALDLKGKVMEAAKDKENQALAKEYAEKAIEYIKKDNEENKPAEVTPAPVVAEKKVNKPQKKSANKKAAKK